MSSMVATCSSPLKLPAPLFPVQEAESVCRQQHTPVPSLHVLTSPNLPPSTHGIQPAPQAPTGHPPQGDPGLPASQRGKRQRGPSWSEAEIRDLLGLWGEEEVLQVMGIKQRNADVFARLAEGLAAWGHPVLTPDHFRSKMKALRQGYAQARDTASRCGATPTTCSFYRELGNPGPPVHLLPPANLDTSGDKPQQAPETEASPAPQGPQQEPTPGAAQQEEEAAASSKGALLIDLPSHSSSRASARWVSPACGSRAERQLHHLRALRAQALCLLCWTAHWGHRSRPTQQRSPDQAKDEPDSAGAIPGRPLTPSCSPPSGISWRCLSTACRWRSSSSTCRSEHWPGTRRLGGLSCGPLSGSWSTWPPPSLRLPSLQAALHQQLSWSLPPRGTTGLRTRPGPICRFSRPLPSLNRASGPDVGRAPPHARCWKTGEGPRTLPPLLCTYSPHLCK
ncbi:uncharacterized protein LOC142003951 [Carettochelys insculpta]|uniref:uncharacterized protein LOC142003951 n=1 Tax=Carettochelys insculpta TaxID=44489 RepID=UPI003EBFEDF6